MPNSPRRLDAGKRCRNTEGLLVFGASELPAGQTRLHSFQRVKVLRQQLYIMLEGGAVDGALVDSAEAICAESVAARQHSRATKRLVRVFFETNRA